MSRYINCFGGGGNSGSSYVPPVQTAVQDVSSRPATDQELKIRQDKGINAPTAQEQAAARDKADASNYAQVDGGGLQI